MADTETNQESVQNTPEVTEPEYTPPTRDEWANHQKELADTAAKLKAANAESADRRQKLKVLEQAGEDETSKAKREAADAAIASLKPIAVKAEAKASFLAEGADSSRVDKLMRLLDMSKIDIEGDSVTGLAEQVSELKTDFPELFKTEEVKTPTPRIDRAGKLPTAPESQTAGQLIASQRNS